MSEGDYVIKEEKVWKPWTPPTKEDCLSQAEYYKDNWWVQLMDGNNHLHVIPAYGTFQISEEHLAWHDGNEECIICGLKPTIALCPRNESCFDWRLDEPGAPY